MINELANQPDVVNGQIKIYEMIARGKPLSEILTSLVLFIESHTPGMICTVLLLDRETNRMWTGAAPNFPFGLSAAIDGSSIGPNAGSCGTAAFRGDNVFVENIETDPLWTEYKSVFLLHGLRSCWSSPILDERSRVLGTFAMYFREPASPTDGDLELINMATRIASAGIARRFEDRALRRNQLQLSLIYENISESIFLVEVLPDYRFRFVFVNPAFLSTHGLRTEQVMDNEVERALPPSSHQLVLSNFRLAMQEKRPVQWDQTVIHPEGKKSIRVTVKPIFDPQGVCIYLVGNEHEIQ